MAGDVIRQLLDGYGVVHEPRMTLTGTWIPLCVVRDGLTYDFDLRYTSASLVPRPISCVRCLVDDQRRYFPIRGFYGPHD